MPENGRYKPFTRFKFQNSHPDDDVEVTLTLRHKNQPIGTPRPPVIVPHGESHVEEFVLHQVIDATVALAVPDVCVHLPVCDPNTEIVLEVVGEYRRSPDTDEFELWCEIVYDYDHRVKSATVQVLQ